MGEVKTTVLGNEKAIAIYYKLHKCLTKAMNDEELSCHVNNIIVKLAKKHRERGNVVRRGNR